MSAAGRPTYIWIRESIDWEDERAVAKDLLPDLRAKQALWDELFTIPFHLFRARLRTIAQLSLDAVEGASVAAWEQIPDQALVMPVDDDDWFAPNAAEVLRRAHTEAARGYVWPARWIERASSEGHRRHMIRMRLFPNSKPHWTCSTNAYAIVKGSERSHLLLESHAKASRSFDEGLARGDGSIQTIRDPISVTNRSLASQTSLGLRKSSIKRAKLIRKYRSYRRLYERPVADEIAWAQPYVSMMKELMAEMELRG